jgi:cardiolipin synthase
MPTNFASYFSIPNLLSYLRGFGAPVFLYIYLGLGNELLGFLILLIGGLTDYLDGKLARALNQTSDFGAKLDPSIDRIYILAVLIALVSNQLIPMWVFLVLIGRDLLVFLVVIFQKFTNKPLLQVTYLGKAATFNLLYAFPFLLISNQSFTQHFQIFDSLSWLNSVPYILGWSFGLWGIALYLLTGFEYIFKGISSQLNQTE